ncbi:alpha/beta hydrolase [Actinoplanes sp. NBRC 103695]|uniref:alpha/beta fold hydrolase n=1 Tax=Actinoplanes sp. NBRC 103695 TaxID=3032202 RepID=UPI0024A04A7D|nr:alpha/beta hydrolase [Actinoplanes sp. NBRC 103695]GLZ01438.1 hydrolase [Actinoplanes sp. NBRC 103695]
MIHYEEAGRGPVVVFLHGGALDLREWDEQMVLAGRFRVIRVDARGHGRSETPMTPFRQCDDVAELLGRLGVERAALVGLSMGAGAATDTALEYPHLVSHLIVCGAGTNEPTFTDPWMLEIQRQMAEAQARLDAPAWIELSLKQGVIGPYRERADRSVEDRCREMITDTVNNHVKPGMVAPHHVIGSWERLGEISVPALGVIGSLDAPDHHAMVDRFVRDVPGARKAEIGGAAHVVNMDRPAEFNELLTQYL